MASSLYNFQIKVVVSTASSTLTFEYGKMVNSIEIHFSVPFSSDSDKSISEITLYNINPSLFNQIKKGNAVSLYAGFAGDVGLVMKGTIYRTTVPTHEDSDIAYVLRVIEGQDYSRLAKQNITFKNGTAASTIIKTIASRAKINLKYVSLKTDKKYSDGYTADDHPMDSLESVADDCKTSLFYEHGQLTLKYVYDGMSGDTYNLNFGSGLLQDPTREDRDEDWTDSDDDDGLGTKSWSVDCILNYHISTFSKVYLKTSIVNTTVFVLDGEHSFDGQEPKTTFEGVQK